MTTEVTPALYEHAFNVYSAMKERAYTGIVSVDDDETGLVYEGFLTKLITKELGLAIPYYTGVTRLLQDMGCISQLRRGGSSSESRWLLIKDPTRELFTEASGAQLNRVSTRDKKMSAATQQIKDLNTRVTTLEEQVAVLLEWFVDSTQV